MKTYSLILLIGFILCSTYSKAQVIEAGIKAGVAASQISGDGYSGFNKAGIIFGGFSRINLSDKNHFQFEISYTQKGSRKNPKTDQGDTEFFLLRLNYIDIPLLYQLDYKNFTFEMGPYFSTLISKHLEDEDGPFELPASANQFKKFDFGLTGGIAFNLTETLIMSWRYSNSILPVRDFESKDAIKQLNLGQGALHRFDAGMFHSYMSFTIQIKLKGKNG